MKLFSSFRSLLVAGGILFSLAFSTEVWATAPVVVSPYNNQVIAITGSTVSPTITGTADPGSSVTVKKDGEPICKAITNNAGSWSCVSTVGFSVGLYALTAQSILGDIAEESPSISCVIIEQELQVPVISSPKNLQEIHTYSTFAYPSISGTATSNSIINVMRDSVLLCSTTVNSNGNWSCTSTYAMGIGVSDIYAISTLGSQSKSSSSVRINIIFDLVTPTIVSPYNNEILYITGTSINPTITGVSNPNAEIVVKKSGSPICTTVADSNGNWSCTSTVGFTPGAYPLTVTATIGKISIDSKEISCVIISYVAPPPSHITPTLLPIADATISCNCKDVTDIYLSGSGTVGASIAVTDASGVVIASSTVNASGSWWATSSFAFKAGSHTLTAVSTLGTSTLSSTPVTFTVNAPNCTPSHTTPVISPVSNITLSCGESSRSLSFSGTGTVGATITLRNASGSLIATTLVSSGGTWSVTPTPPFTVGSQSVRVESILGNSTLVGNTVTFTISPSTDCSAPHTTPTILPVQDSTLACGYTSDGRTFSGSGTPGATITLKNGSGTVLGSSVTVDSKGSWTVAYSPFYPGNYTVYASSTLGSSTLTSSSISFRVTPAPNCGPTHTPPTLNPLIPVTLSCTGSSITDVYISGSGTTGASIVVMNASGVVVASSTVNASGSWWATSSYAFASGSHTLTANSTLGNSTLSSTPIIFVVSSSTECNPAQKAPIIAPVSNITLACGTTATGIVFTGTGTPGATIIIKNNSGATLATALVDASGSFIATSWSLLPAGIYSVRVYSELGGVTVEGNSISFTIFPATGCGGGVTHIAPVIAPVSNISLPCGTTATGRVFTGTGTPGALITLKNASGSILTTTTVGTGGTWVSSSLTYASGSYSVIAESLYANTVLTGNAIIFTISPSTDCNNPPVHTTPVISPVSNITLSCGESSRSLSFSGTGTVGATITLRNASGSLIATTLVSSGGTWSVTPTPPFTVGSQSVRVESILGNSTLVGNTVTFTISPATGCGGGGGGGGSTGPGGPSPSLYSYPILTPTTLAPVPVRPVSVPTRPLTRYEIAQTLERKSLNVRPYWIRFPKAKTPTQTFFGTGPKTLTERTHIVTSQRVETSDDALTRKAQSKKTFPLPLLGN